MEIELITHMGNDDTVASAARVSFHKEAANFTPEKNEKLIKYLARHNHWSPFAHTAVTLRVKIPVFLARQWFKHIVGSVKNEVSRRYVDFTPEIYTPAWRHRPDGSVKQGSGQSFGDTTAINHLYLDATTQALRTYDKLLEAGVAPEQARAVLPQSMYTEFWDTASLVYWARMYKQRSESTAQSEWYDLMADLHKLVGDLYPVSWEALTGEYT